MIGERKSVIHSSLVLVCCIDMKRERDRKLFGRVARIALIRGYGIAHMQVLYTGDFSRVEDRHLMAAEIPPVTPDILICVRRVRE